MSTSIQVDLRIQHLRTEVERHLDAYHRLDAPEIPDSDYDQLFKELRQLEAENPHLMTADSPTLRVGGAVLDGFEQVRHDQPMLSLEDAMNESEAEAFVRSVIGGLQCGDDIELTSELKYDGLAVKARYVEGLLVQAATRGDGYIGEDVTAQARTIKNLPLRLPVPITIEVRGEVVLLKHDFETVNAHLIAQGLKPLANTRNGAAGSMRQLDPKVTASRRLSFYAYGAFDFDGNPAFDATTQWEVLEGLRSLGFSIAPESKVVRGWAGMLDFYTAVGVARSALPVDIDGVVFKVNSIADQRRLGWNNRTPRFAIAHKFPAEEAQSVVQDIVVQIGRTGTATPVAKIKPVRVGGVMVSSATLHNGDQIQSKGISIGSTVMVRRAGDVVPEIVCTVPTEGDDALVRYVMPSTCPSCHSELQRHPKEVKSFCPGGIKCPAQKQVKVAHFGSRLGMNIDNLGEKSVAALIDADLISLPSDLYSLAAESVARLPGFGVASARKLVAGIDRSKSPELPRFIFALGIEDVGEATSKALATKFGSWDAFRNASYDQLMATPEVGDGTASNIQNFFSDEVLGQEADLLAQLAVPQAFESANGQALKGMTFVLTGVFPTMSRQDAKALVERAGGKVSGTVSSKTTALVAGEAAGSKLDAARNLAITIWDEAQLIAAAS